jgi:hypothetical protein
MSVTSLLTPLEIREYLQDFTQNNYLLDGEEFSDTFINLCMTFAVESFNMIPPSTNVNTGTIPSKSLLLYGTLWHMFLGRSATLARNHMSYTDGGIQIPIEERSELYQALARQFEGIFKEESRTVKTQMNMDSGWDGLSSDYSMFPIW